MAQIIMVVSFVALVLYAIGGMSLVNAAKDFCGALIGLAVCVFVMVLVLTPAKPETKENE